MGKNKAGKVLDLKNLHHYPAQILNSQAVHPDPAASFPGAPPLFGKDVVPHIYTVAGWVGSQARAYPLEDEALRDSTENAERMRRHPDIKECLLARQRAVALLPWHLQPEDEHDPVQKQLVADLTSIVERTHRWVELRRNLMEAIWYGKGFVQLRYGVKQVKGRWRKVAADWEPRHPDKILFRYSDGTNEYVPGQVGIRIHAGARGINREQIEATQYGLAYWLRDFERRVCIVHKHEIEDGPFLDPRASGRIHGVGLRDSVYWTWYASVEVEQKLLEYLDRTALGIEIWRYPSGNKEAEKQARAAAEERIGGGRSIVMVPVIPGEQADLFGVQHIEPGPQGAELLKTICQDFYAHKIKRLILGQTLTSEAESTGMGSGVADAHLATFSDIIRYDAVNLQESLTDDFIQVLKEENFPWARGIHIRLILNTERPETQEKLAAYNEAWNMGLKVRAEDLYALIGARRPDDEDEVLQNPNIMMAEQQQAMMMAQAGAPPPGQPGDPTQVAMGDTGPAVAAMGQPGAPPMEVEKSAAAEPGAQPVNPWAGFWDSLFAAARGQGVPSPAGQPGIMPPVGNTRPVDHLELTRLFQDRFREAILTRRQTAAQFREALESAIAQQPDRDNLQLRLGFLFAWKKAEPVAKIKAAFQEAIDNPHSAMKQSDPVKQQLLDALAENPAKAAFQEAFERQQGPREQLLKALRETVAPDQYTQGQEGIRVRSTAGNPGTPQDPQPDESPVVEADRPAPLGALFRITMDDALARYRAGEWTAADLDAYALAWSIDGPERYAKLKSQAGQGSLFGDDEPAGAPGKHDVSDEARDASGEWTASGGSPVDAPPAADPPVIEATPGQAEEVPAKKAVDRMLDAGIPPELHDLARTAFLFGPSWVRNLSPARVWLGDVAPGETSVVRFLRKRGFASPQEFYDKAALAIKPPKPRPSTPVAPRPEQPKKPTVLIQPTETKGVFSVHRKDGEEPFARMYSPAASGTRRWHVKYRRYGDEPFGDPTFHAGADNREDAIREVENMAKNANDYQLGFTDAPPAKTRQ